MIGYCTDGWNEITPGLWMGGHDRQGRHDEPHYAMTVRVADEFDLVVSLYQRDGCGPDVGVDHLYYSIPDGVLEPGDAVELEAIAERVAEAVRAGRRVLVRCQAGLNRSGLVTALTLIRLGHATNEAIDLIRERRSPDALFNGHFVAYLLGRARQQKETTP